MGDKTGNEPRSADGSLALLRAGTQVDLKRGRKLAKQALRSLTLGHDKLRLRDAHVTIGNFYARWGKTDLALDHYRLAEKGERDYTRRALARFNAAKLLLTTNRPHEGLDVLRKLDPSRIADARVRTAIKLGACRAHQLFGYHGVANAILATFRGKVPPPPLATEFRYLALIARATPETPRAFVPRLEDFAKHAPKDGLYELEAILFRLVAAPETIKNRERALARAGHLAKMTGMKRLYALTRLLERALAPRGLPASKADALADLARELLATDHALSVRTALIWACARLLDRHRFALAAQLVEALQLHLGQLLGPLLLRGTRLPPGCRLPEDLAALTARFPRGAAPDARGFDWLYRLKT